MPRALVTGATGLVGSHIVERLHEKGWSVRALVRDPDTATARALGDVEHWRGDILDEVSFANAAAGCDTIFHAAAVITPRGGWKAFEHTNIGGTRNAITAAKRAGARLVHVSSVAVYGAQARYRSAAGRTDETTSLAPLPERAYYARSKRESEALVMDAHAKGHIWATAVRPAVIYGRGDRQFVPRVARLLRWGVAPVIGRGRSTLAIVHAAHVADGAVRAAMTDAAGGKAYNVANDFDITVASFFRLAAAGLGRHVILVRIPVVVAAFGFRATQAVDSLIGGRLNVVNASSLEFLTRDNPFASALARRELGWAPWIRPEVGVADAFNWWTTHR